MLQGKKITVIGGGKMGSIIAQALIKQKLCEQKNLIVTDIDAARRTNIASLAGVNVSDDNKKAASDATIIILAVKPQNMREILAEISPAIDHNKIIISIAAGITTALMESLLPKGARVLRVMPNTPALIGEGAAAVAKGSFATDADLKLTRAVFDAVGISVAVDEKLMDAVTGLSGSGPAYFFLFIEALIEAGEKVGLSYDLAAKLSMQTMLGAARLCLQGDKKPAELREMVTSPGGTTAAGLKVLNEGKIREVIIAAVEAATARSQELAGGK
ncbi:MAG TPA: pyrroline-5-carboxylate reductase [Smithellaceae bacterium]|nr:pyrroline-5-carboxylate reductase [Smithellaceae bacterium]HRS90328.1 pyrroline-5-carboxylate reductase [Smithellaceae bacterium]HRV27116.1 pyrroline-5-carboxylate reductase [Smithellaceae bacterium]